MAKYDVFLSHATRDKPAVKQLARRLIDAGLTPFLDEWDLIVGQPIQESLEEALKNSQSCVVCIGPDKIGPWHEQELRVALNRRVSDKEFRVIPVMLPGAVPPRERDLPDFLSLLLWVDFSASLDDEGAFKRLLSGIRGLPPGPDAAPGVKPVSDDPPPSPPRNKPAAADYSGRQKLAVCDGLYNDWQRLAAVLKIPPYASARFEKGDEGRRIWEWLESRRRLGDLPQALRDIGLDDLADELEP